MISRKKNRIGMVFLMAFLIFMLIGTKFEIKAFVGLAFVCAIVCLVIMRTENKCPECKAHFKGLYWKGSPEKCKECGARIIFDDEETESDSEELN